MTQRFVIWAEDQHGNITRAMTWRGTVQQGIARVRADAQTRGVKLCDVWATPVRTPVKNYTREFA